MAIDDLVTERQLELIRGIARKAIPDFGDYHGEEMYEYLDPLVQAVYGRACRALNRGQASMLIDDLMYNSGDSDVEPDYQSIV
jgi:hypothetical protein